MDGVDTPQTVMTTRAIAVVTTMWRVSLEPIVTSLLYT